MSVLRAAPPQGLRADGRNGIPGRAEHQGRIMTTRWTCHWLLGIREEVRNKHVIALPHTHSETDSNKEAATSTAQNRSERQHILQHTEPHRCSKPAASTGTAMEFGGAEDAQRGLDLPCYERRKANKK